MAKKKAAGQTRKTLKKAARKTSKAATRARGSVRKSLASARRSAKKARRAVTRTRTTAAKRAVAAKARSKRTAKKGVSAARKSAKTATKSVKAARKRAKTAKKTIKKAVRKAQTSARTAKSAATQTARRVTRKTNRAAAKASSSVKKATSAPKRALGNARNTARAVAIGIAAPVTPPRARKEPARKPNLDRPRKTVADIHGVPSTLDADRGASAARTGRAEYVEKLQEHTSTSPALAGGDVDADWQSADSVGDEAPGGTTATPDQDVVDEIGRALGVEYNDDEELQGGDEIAARDRHRWELDPDSKDDDGDDNS